MTAASRLRGSTGPFGVFFPRRCKDFVTNKKDHCSINYADNDGGISASKCIGVFYDYSSRPGRCFKSAATAGSS